jgi:hypothetical protein
MTIVDVIIMLAAFFLGAFSTAMFYEGYYRDQMRLKDREIQRLKEDNFRMNQRLLSR